MDFLVLAPTPTFPNDLGSRKGIVTLHQSLRRYGRIHYVLYTAEGEWRDQYDQVSLDGMRQQWDSVHIIPNSRWPHPYALGEDHEVDEWWDPSVGEYLQWRFQRSQFNAFIVHYTWLSRALTYAPSAVHKVLYTADRFSNRRQLFESRGLGREFFHLTIDGEREALSRADTVIAVKEQEEEFFKTLVDRTVITVPHYEPALPSPPLPRAEGVFTIGFIGGDNTINRVNFLDFMKVFTPMAARAFAPVEILVAGGICNQLKGYTNPLVRQVGYVENLADFYGASDLAIVPMEFSTGIKIKFAEALAAGTPLISTAHAAEGYETTHPYMACADFAAMAEACIACAMDPRELDGLRKETVRSFALAEERLTTSVDLLAGIIARDNPVATVVAPRDLRVEDGMNFTRLLDLVGYLRWRCKTDVLLLPGTVLSAKAMRRLGALASLYEVREGSVTLTDQREAGAAAVPAPRRWPEQATRRGALFCLDHDAEVMLPLIARADMDIYVDVNTATMAAAWPDIVASGTRSSLTALANTFQTLPSADPARNVDALLVPMLYRSLPRLGRAWGEKPIYRPIIHLLAQEQHRFLARGLARWLATVSFYAQLRVITATTVDGAPRDLGQAIDDIALMGDRPLLVLDAAGPAPELNALREMYTRCCIPALRIDPASEPVRRTATPGVTLAEAMRVCTVALKGGGDFTPWDARARAVRDDGYQNDVGWAQIWRNLGLIKSVQQML